MNLIDPQFGFAIVIWGGWALFASGVLHLIVWVIGEFRPTIYHKFKAKIFRQLLTGTSNRLMFGLGGIVLLLIGGVFVIIGEFAVHFARTLPAG